VRLVQIASLVEGDGEVEALPVLIRRIVAEIDLAVTPIVPRPFRHPAGSVQKMSGLERALDAVAERSPAHSIVVLLDCDDDCPRELGPRMARRAKQARPDLYISFILAHREYESWFLAAAESLAGKRRLATDLVAPEIPESIRDAKSWLSQHIQGAGRYSPTQDQAALSKWLDLNRARVNSRSFRKFWKEIEGIVRMAG
jgi:Domain of unknown function (DUF4276)